MKITLLFTLLFASNIVWSGYFFNRQDDCGLAQKRSSWVTFYKNGQYMGFYTDTYQDVKETGLFTGIFGKPYEISSKEKYKIEQKSFGGLSYHLAENENQTMRIEFEKFGMLSNKNAALKKLRSLFSCDDMQEISLNEFNELTEIRAWTPVGPRPDIVDVQLDGMMEHGKLYSTKDE